MSIGKVVGKGLVITAKAVKVTTPVVVKATKLAVKGAVVTTRVVRQQVKEAVEAYKNGMSEETPQEGEDNGA